MTHIKPPSVGENPRDPNSVTDPSNSSVESSTRGASYSADPVCPPASTRPLPSLQPSPRLWFMQPRSLFSFPWRNETTGDKDYCEI